MIKELVPQQNPDDAKYLKSFLTHMYNTPDVQRYVTYTLRPFSEKTINTWLANHQDDNVHYYAFLRNYFFLSSFRIICYFKSEHGSCNRIPHWARKANNN